MYSNIDVKNKFETVHTFEGFQPNTKKKKQLFLYPNDFFLPFDLYKIRSDRGL